MTAICCPSCGRPLETAFRLEPETGTLIVDGCRVDLTPSQSVILGALLGSNGACVPVRDLLRALYGTHGVGEPAAPEKTLHALMCHLRRRLAGTRLAIETRRGYGFIAVLKPEAT